MSSFHDQWMDAWHETAALPEGATRRALLAQLETARVLIDEEGPYADRRLGGEIIRFVRQDARRAAA